MIFPKTTIKQRLSKIKSYATLPLDYAQVCRKEKKGALSVEQLKQLGAERPVTVFWSVDSGLSYHFISLCILAKTLQSQGYPVLMIRCHKQLSRCTVIDSYDAKPDLNFIEKSRICTVCMQKSIDYISAYHLPFVHLSDLCQQEALDTISQELHAINDITSFEYHGMDFGKIALGEVFRVRKLYDTQLSEAEQKHIQKHILGCIANFQAFDTLRKLIPIQRVVYFNDYGNVLGVAGSAIANDIPITNISHALLKNVTRNQIIFSHALSTRDQFNKLDKWQALKNFPLSPSQVAAIGDDLLNRMSKGGFTIYSPKKTLDAEHIYEQLQLDKSKTLIVAFTSSLDEAEATKLQYAGLKVPNLPSQHIFKDQIEWLQHLVQFVKNNQQCQLIVRVHPREGRDVYKPLPSKHLVKLKQLFDKTPNNVKMIWPEDPTSTYDLMEMADVPLISWTSVGLELARLGSPALAAFEHCPYPKEDVVLWAKSQADYFCKLKALCEHVPSEISKIQYAFRWFHLVRLGSTLDISDMASDPNVPILPAFKQPKHTPEITDILINNKNILDINYQASNRKDHTEEHKAIITFLQRAVWFLFTGKVLNKTISLELSHDVNQPLCNAFDGLFVALGNRQVKLITQDLSYEKTSPMLSRLFQLLCAQQEA